MFSADRLPILVSCGSFVIALLSLVLSFQAKQQAKNAALLALRREAINQIRHAIDDVSLHDSIRADTVTSIREALQLSPLVFSRTVSDMLDLAHKIAFRLQGSSEQRTEQEDRDRDTLEKQLETILNAMNKKASLTL
jgi:hypothetical protein